MVGSVGCATHPHAIRIEALASIRTKVSATQNATCGVAACGGVY